MLPQRAGASPAPTSARRTPDGSMWVAARRPMRASAATTTGRLPDWSGERHEHRCRPPQLLLERERDHQTACLEAVALPDAETGNSTRSLRYSLSSRQTSIRRRPASPRTLEAWQRFAARGAAAALRLALTGAPALLAEGGGGVRVRTMVLLPVVVVVAPHWKMKSFTTPPCVVESEGSRSLIPAEGGFSCANPSATASASFTSTSRL